jgi:hypothetical protein
MMTLNRTLPIARRTLALAALLGAGLTLAQAQQAAGTPDAAAALPTLNLHMPSDAREAMFSSSSEQNEIAFAEDHIDFLGLNDRQPPPRRSYGRPRYRGGNTNPDGSNKYLFLIGGGYTQPLGNTHKYLTPSWGFQVGGGRNWNKNFGVTAQFDWDNFGFQGNVLANQLAIYNSPNVFGAGAISTLDGTTHIWSLTLNPTFTIAQGDSGLGAYVVVGGGFYHKRADFTTPTIGLEEDQFGNIFQFQANQTVDDYDSNAPGVNAGLGLTYKVSRFSGERLYAEARYVYIANPQRAGFTVATINQIQPTSTNLFPANSNRTGYVPVKVGIRF